jgi:D-alanyl-lipoteichoic acid acyltransferase DltB (MBOAT superfamily)
LLGVLGIFKYAGFFMGSLAEQTASLGVASPSGALQINLPVGISFYVFHAISYVVDVYRRQVVPNHSPVDVALYIAFFPQLVAGPILRAAQFLPQMKTPRRLDGADLSEGVRLFLLGWCYKVVIADSLAAVVDPVFASPQNWRGLAHWIATLAYAGQIYFDFAGYSSMAIGAALLLGYRMPRNFAYPYSALSITEFWRRWHISLSTWLRDYLFIPLGGNRGGRAFYYRNLMLTMVLGGLWHGASWNFVIWGAMHGAALVGHKMWLGPQPDAVAAVPPTLRAAASLLLTQAIVVVAWVFFRSPNLDDALTMMGGMFGHDPAGATRTYEPALALFVLLPIAIDAIAGRWSELRPGVTIGRISSAAALGVIVAALLWAHPLADTPFIYFQF